MYKGKDKIYVEEDKNLDDYNNLYFIFDIIIKKAIF